MKDNIGVYIHIPFCVRKCMYCDFLSFPAEESYREQYVELLVKEIRQYGCVAEYPVKADTVFIGGGTPTVLSASQIERIIDALGESVELARHPEITIECNPGTVTFETLRQLRRMGINRISFGVQSAVQAELEALGRIHTFQEAADTFRQAREAGFENINIDLMSAIPGQTITSYQYTLEQVLVLSPEHVSAYSLIIEEGTPFYERFDGQPPVDEDTDRQMYQITKELLQKKDYERYEISNYARAGAECRHNLKYWSGEEYKGFGLGAYSRIRNTRYKNESDMARYQKSIEAGECPANVEEVLDTGAERSEYIILGMRRTQGISRREFEQRFSADILECYGDVIRKFAKQGLLILQGDRIAFTDKGLDVSNYVLCEFL